MSGGGDCRRMWFVHACCKGIILLVVLFGGMLVSMAQAVEKTCESEIKSVAAASRQLIPEIEAVIPRYSPFGDRNSCLYVLLR